MKSPLLAGVLLFGFCLISLDAPCHDASESQIRGTAEPDFWPSGHAAGAVSATFRWSGLGQQLFRIYVWREEGDMWAEVQPQSSPPFICSPDFAIIQKGVLYESVKLETHYGSAQCGDVYSTSVYRLTQWSFLATKADLNEAFTLLFYGASPDTYRLEIPSAPLALLSQP